MRFLFSQRQQFFTSISFLGSIDTVHAVPPVIQLFRRRREPKILFNSILPTFLSAFTPFISNSIHFSEDVTEQWRFRDNPRTIVLAIYSYRFICKYRKAQHSEPMKRGFSAIEGQIDCHSSNE